MIPYFNKISSSLINSPIMETKAKLNSSLLIFGFFLILLSTFILFFPSLGERAIWGSEGRWATISKGMVESGDYFTPRINGKVYYDKPLFSYWLVVASYFVTGKWDELTLRIPSAVMAIGSSLLLFFFLYTIFSWEAAVFGALILSTSWGIVFWGHTSQVETHTLFSILLSMVLFYLAWSRNNGWLMSLFWIVSCVFCQMKGLISLALPIAVSGLFLTVEYGLEEKQKNPTKNFWPFFKGFLRGCWFFLRPKSLLGFSLGVALYLLPFMFSEAGRLGLWMVFKENLVRYFKAFDHRGHWYTYLINIPFLFLPWTLFIPFLPYKEIRENQKIRFFWIWFLGTWIFFQCSSSKRSYYILPILAPLSALLSWQLAGYWKKCSHQISHIYYRGILVLFSIACFIVFLGGFLFPQQISYQKLWMILFFLFGLQFFQTAIQKPTFRVFFILFLIFNFLFYTFLWGVIIPWGDQFRPLRVFYRDPFVQQKIVGNGKVALYRVSRSAAHYFYLSPPHPIPHFWKEKDALSFLLQNDHYLILPFEQWKILKKSYPKLIQKWMHYQPPRKAPPFQDRPKEHLLVIWKK
ncbi:MAG: hypothetical protein D6785_10785 [Planctomycetota bacterium]|nr:MAG: hypothetical protein D6785_10785 [Planctomycetota bacterium]